MNDRDGNRINTTAKVVKPPRPVVGEVVLMKQGVVWIVWEGGESDTLAVGEDPAELVVVENPVAVLTEFEWEVVE